jgi:hypothetical protein
MAIEIAKRILGAINVVSYVRSRNITSECSSVESKGTEISESEMQEMVGENSVYCILSPLKGGFRD